MNIKGWLITYQKGRPEGTTLTFYGTYEEAFSFAAIMAHGWGFKISELGENE